jgi:hypothetical protein
VLLALPLRAEAQALPLELRWSAPAECPSEADVHAELARIVEIEPDRVPSALSAAVTIVRARDRLRLRIETERDGERGQRTLIADDCTQVLRAVTLVLALAYGEGVALRVDEPSPAPIAPAVIADEAPSAQAREATSEDAIRAGGSTPTASTPSSLRAGLFVEVGAVAGVLPAPSFEGAIGVELGEPFWRARVRASVAPHAEIDLGENVLARFIAMSGSIEGCGGAPIGIVRGEACAGVVVAGLYGRAIGTALDREALAPWIGLRASLGVGITLDRVELRLIAALIGNPVPPRFAITGLGDVHRVADVSGHGALGLAWLP